MIVCPACGNENPEGSRFCSNCGTALTSAGPAPAAGATNPASPAADAAASGSAVPEPDKDDGSVAPPGTAKAVPPMPEPRTWAPQVPSAGNPASALPATSPEWRMSDAGPLPEPRGRRRWLWILVGILGACLLLCVGLTIWGNTDSGTRVLNDLATSLAEAATPRAGTPSAGD